MNRIGCFGGLCLAICGCLATGLQAQEETTELGWFDEAELSLVATNGNAEAETLGFKNTLRRVWEEAEFTLKASGLRAESTTRRLRAVLEPSGGVGVFEENTSELTAENYALSGRYHHELTEALFWFVSAGWERNEFAGFANRYSAQGGVGHRWFEREKAGFRTDYSLTYTRQEDLVPTPERAEDFVGARFALEYRRQLTASTQYTNSLTVDENLEDTSDLRAELDQAIAVAISQRLALKVRLRLLYDHQPAVQAVSVEPALTDTVLVELEELDSTLQVALVVKF